MAQKSGGGGTDMSGIYIPGMELPESCGSCDTQGLKNAIWHFGFGCDGDIDDFANCPPARCPLVSVPEHGRLGDLDELKAKGYALSALRIEKDNEGRLKGWRELVSFDEVPTIIPADPVTEVEG